MYSRYDPTIHDTFLPVTDEHSDDRRTIEFPRSDPAAETPSEKDTGTESVPVSSSESIPAAAAVSAADASAPAGGLLSGLKGLLGGLKGGQGLKLDFDIGDMILLLIIALLFLEGGETSDIIILIGVVLLLGF